MFNIGDLVKISSVDAGVDKIFINKIGTITQIKPKEYYKYHIEFKNEKIEEKGTYYWWSEENIELFTEDVVEYDDTNEEDAYKKIIITTTNNVDGYKVKEYIDIISCEYVIGTGLFSEFTTSIQDFCGLRSTAFESKLSEAKKDSVEYVKYNAYKQGGDAVIGVDVEYTTFEGNRVAVIITGTIVKLEPIEKLS